MSDGARCARLEAFARRHNLDASAQAELLLLLEAAFDSPALETVSISPEAPPLSPPMAQVRASEAEKRLPFSPRYQDLGALGRGGMGEVRRVRDLELKRTVALKVIRKSALGKAESVARFLEEARATAQLEHPGIVPVHDLGTLPDGRLYFTMKEIKGETLQSVLRALHQASDPERWGTTSGMDGQPGWSFPRLIGAFHKVCETMAYAHARGVVHRDLKPTNIMVGAFGEVLVLDWGLAKVDVGHGALGRESLETLRSEALIATKPGFVAGTPAYMPPEQARGENNTVSPAWDVYTLGAVLYEILCGHPPYEGKTPGEVLMQVLSVEPISVRRRRLEHARSADATTLFVESPPAGVPAYTPVRSSEDRRIPEELQRVCERAMAREPAGRYPNATELALDVADWLDGVLARG